MPENTEAQGSELSGGLGATFTFAKPKHTLSFWTHAGEKVGEFDFDQAPATFDGNVDESARIFVEAVCRIWGDDLLSIQRERYAKMVDYILREGGGTYGDLIRNA